MEFKTFCLWLKVFWMSVLGVYFLFSKTIWMESNLVVHFWKDFQVAEIQGLPSNFVQLKPVSFAYQNNTFIFLHSQTETVEVAEGLDTAFKR